MAPSGKSGVPYQTLIFFLSLADCPFLNHAEDIQFRGLVQARLDMKKPLCLVALCCALSGCLYSNIRFPLDEDLWKTELGTKVGVSSNHSVLWLVAWGDAGVKEAAENGNISVINHMDMGIKTYFFGAYTRRDTIVYGD